MLVHTLRSSVLLIAVLVLSACGGKYQVTEPAKGSIHNTPPNITITYQERPESLPLIDLNGTNITHLFTVSDTEATTSGSAIETFLKEGNNSITIHDDPKVTSHFIYDTSPPKLVVRSADRGSLVTINGRVIDNSVVESIYVNGLAFDVGEDGQFTAKVTPSDIYSFEIEDPFGYSNRFEYRDYNLLYDDSLKARVNQSGLDFIADELVGLVNNLDFNALIGGTELYKSGIFRGELTSIDLTADSFYLDPTSNELLLEGVFKDVRAKLRLVNIIVIKPTLRVDTVRLTGGVLLDAVDGDPQITVTDLNVDLQGISFDGALGGFDKFLGGLISGLVERFEGKIANEIKKVVNNSLSEQLASLIPSSYQLNVSGKRLEMHFNLKDLYTSDDSLFVGLSGGVLPMDLNPLIPEPLGPIYTDDSLPEPKYSKDLGLAVNTNVINQTLVAAYASGLTHLTIIGDQVGFDIPRNNDGETGTNRLLINPGAAPFIQLQESQGQSSTTMDIRNLKVISQKKTDSGWKQEFSVEVDASIAISISVNNDSTLAINFVSDPEIDLRNILVGEGLIIPPAFIENLLQGEIPKIMGQISKALNGIRLPKVAGLEFIADDFHPLGEDSTHAGLTGSLRRAD